MKLNEFIHADDERAVSPVIGVILMVAITVILAAVIGTFVLGLGDQVQETAPNAQFSGNFEGEVGTGTANLTFAHEGGDSIDSERLTYVGPGIDATDNRTDAFAGSGTVSAGSSETIQSSELASEGEVRLVWESEEGGSSTVLRTYDLPDA